MAKDTVDDLDNGDAKHETVTTTTHNDTTKVNLELHNPDKPKPSNPDKDTHSTPDDESDWEDNEEELEGCMKGVKEVQEKMGQFWNNHKRHIKYILCFMSVVAYFVYFSYALMYHFGDEGSIRLVWVTSLVVLGMVLSTLFNHFGQALTNKMAPLLKVVKKNSTSINTFFLCSIFIAFIIVVIVDLATHQSDPYNLVSLSGIATYILLLFLFSTNPSKVKWRTVAWGFGLQVSFAMIILRWSSGYDSFKWLGDRFSEYFTYVQAGSRFIFGDSYADHFFAFQILPTIIFISSSINLLFYLGVMQWFILKIAWLMQACMGTTAGESVNAAGNIFIGQTESPLLIRPILPSMTRSEIHAVMTGGYATIAGGVMAAFILFGVPANHLLSASVMSAPAALAISKLFYPETKKSLTSAKDVTRLIENCAEKNIVEAAASGASSAIPLVANIAANLIAFISLLEFLNGTLTWFGDRVGAERDITFQFLCSYFMWPFALLMGVRVEDCRKVGQLIGVKTFVNEFVAYEELSVFLGNRKLFDKHVINNGTWSWIGNRDDMLLYHPNGTNITLHGGIIHDRSVVISTYALCGFSNIASIGIQIGAFTAMVPNRKHVFSQIAVRAMIAGTVSCFVTACIAGLFYKPTTT